MVSLQPALDAHAARANREREEIKRLYARLTSAQTRYVTERIQAMDAADKSRNIDNVVYL